MPSSKKTRTRFQVLSVSLDLGIQQNHRDGNSNSEGKRKTVLVSVVDCKIHFALVKIDSYDFSAL